MTTLHNLWATPIWELDIDAPIAQLLQDIPIDNNNLDYVDYQVWDLPFDSVSDFKQIFQQIIQDTIAETYQDYNVTLSIKKSWINKQSPGEKIPAHNHNGINLIAILYLQGTTNSGDLILLDSRGGVDWGWDTYNGYTGTKCVSFTPVVGKLLLMPAYIVHYVEENKTDINRISLVTELKLNLKLK